MPSVAHFDINQAVDVKAEYNILFSPYRQKRYIGGVTHDTEPFRDEMPCR